MDNFCHCFVSRRFPTPNIWYWKKMKIEHRTTILDDIYLPSMIPSDMSYLWANGRHPREQTASCTHNNIQHTSKNRKHHHYGPPKLPASSGSNFTGEYDCDRCTLCNWYQSPQYGNLTFIDKTNCSVISFTITLQAVVWRACRQKVSFYKLLLMLFCTNALELCALTSAIWRCFVCQYPTSTSHV